jgi:hypothetical protein
VRRRHRLRAAKTGRSETEFGVCFTTVRALRSADQKTCARTIAARKAQWPILASGDRPPGVRSSLGQDRLVPIFLATLAIRQQSQTIQFRSAAEMLDSFGMQQGGTQYRRLVAAFQRIFGATIFFGTDSQREKAAVVHRARFNFMSEARIWYSRDTDQATLPGGFQNEIVLSHEFFKEIMSHPIPTDMEAAKALSCSRRRSICLCGSPIAASLRRAGNAFHCSATLDS